MVRSCVIDAKEGWTQQVCVGASPVTGYAELHRVGRERVATLRPDQTGALINTTLKSKHTARAQCPASCSSGLGGGGGMPSEPGSPGASACARAPCNAPGSRAPIAWLYCAECSSRLRASIAAHTPHAVRVAETIATRLRLAKPSLNQSATRTKRRRPAIGQLNEHGTCSLRVHLTSSSVRSHRLWTVRREGVPSGVYLMVLNRLTTNCSVRTWAGSVAT